jgi:general secretion pathway protein D
MAVRKLDQVPRQVLIEATIAEVTLSDSLKYGLQWFFKGHNVGNKYTGIGSLDLKTNVAANDALGGGGFNYALTGGAGEVLALLDVLAGQSKVKILSSPHLMVIDNQTAEIKVGDQVPVRTGSTVTDGGLTTESIQYKDTGVLLGVTPRVNAGGLVTMEVNQEVTDLGDIEPTTQQRRFLQRTITSSVAVQTGETLVLGGLITENRNVSESGIPGLYQMPVVGPLFGSTTDDTKRTELLVLITPRVVRDQQEARQVTEELRGKLLGIGNMPEAGTTRADVRDPR